MLRIFTSSIVIVAMLLLSPPLAADEIRVAVASNFAEAMTALVSRFEEVSGHTVIPVYGSTGKHYAQIVNGAPFDAFLAADVERPKLLEEEGRVVAGSRFAYAVGRLVLWSPTGDRVDPEGQVLRQGQFRHLALANPELAPYGRAAEETLRAMGLWERLEPCLVRGENISQTYLFVSSGSTELGFVALSQVRHPDKPIEGSSWIIPQKWHQPIEQQAVLLKDSKTARHFLEFIGSGEAKEIIRGFGYAPAPEAEAPAP
jgi:molybdate transport system substrate-binding protein